MAIHLDGLCDRTLDGPLWDNDLTVNTQDPYLSLCFQFTILDWIPSIWLLISLPYVIYSFSKLRNLYGFSEIGKFNLLKTVLVLLLAVFTLLDIIEYAADAGDGAAHGSAFLIGPIVKCIALIYVAGLTHYEFRKGINSSGVLFIFWFLEFLVLTIQTAMTSKPVPTFGFNSTGSNSSSTSIPWTPEYLKLDSFRYATLLVSYVLTIVIALLNLFPDNECLKHLDNPLMSAEHKPILENVAYSSGKNVKIPSSVSTEKKVWPPEIYSPFILRITFWWFSKMTWTGYRRALTLDDCWDLLPQYRSDNLVPTIIRSWEQQVRGAVVKQARYASRSGGGAAYNVNSSIHISTGIENPAFHSQSTLVSQNADDLLTLRTLQSKPETDKKYVPSLVAAIWSVIGPLYLLNAGLKVVYDLLTFVQPLLLSLLVAVVTGADPIQWHGYIIALGMFCAGGIRSLVLATHYHTGMMCGLKIRAAMTGLVYRKALLLSTTGKKDSTVGEIVNLMSVDIQRIQDALPFLNLLWSSPVIITIAIVLLYAQLGAAAFAGFGVMVMLIPINLFIATRLRKYQGRQMINKDERIKLSTEILNGMKVLKLYGWETAYLRVIDAIRTREVEMLKITGLLGAALSTTVFIAPFLVAAVSFIVYIFISPSNVLTPNVVSVSLSLINIMNFPVSFFPQIIAMSVQVAISIGRLREYLLKDEILPNNVTYSTNAPHAVDISNGTFSWGRDEPPLLKKVNLRVPDSALMAVVGTVGSGKSSLLHAMLGEMIRVEGQVTLRGRIAYVPQQAWIINASVRDNILFGMEYSKSKYDRVIQACALEPDFKIMENGDLTEVGERGINMSGGQKQRISIARAVYQNADVYVMDDPLSAVDSHVAKHIFDNVLGPNGLLAHKTRILVTHAVNILPKMEQIIVMKDGDIVENGTFDELLRQNGGFAEFIREFLLEEEEDEDEEQLDPESAALKRTLLRQISIFSGDEGGKDFEEQRSSLRRRKSRAGGSIRSVKTVKKEEKPEPRKKLILEETSREGSVEWAVYADYINALSITLCTVAGCSYLLYIAGGVGTNVWLSYWSADAASNATDLVFMRMGVYIAFGFTQMILILIHTMTMAFATTRASRLLHSRLFSRLMRAPMAFFDTTPLGRITNRLSKDIDTVDVSLPMTLKQWVLSMAVCFQTIVLIIISNWVLILIVAPVILLFCVIQRFYINTSRQLKRMDSVLRSPIFAHFQNSLLGTTSIRAYKITDRFTKMSDEFVDRSMTAYYPQCISARWLGTSLDTLGNLMILTVAMVSAASSSIGFDASLASLAITYTTTMTNSITMAVRSMTDLETYVVSIERLKEYSELVTEAPLEDPDNLFVPKDWPQRGKVEFSNYSVRYRPGLDLVLRDISCTVQPNEKVGIVGRTGAGKSSLSLGLFRLLEPANGTIIVDGIDIARLGLQTLRDRVTIIPQEPVLFSGTLRRNIDPFERHSDEQIWQSLECSHLKNFVQSQPNGLDFLCSEGGENLSVGQRQLLCMARAVLRRSKILLLDEATAAVDVETDQLIQKTIREEFRDCTILTIAHRLNTVLDYNKIIVLDQGRVKEFDSPNNLLADKSSQFYSMAKDAGLVHDS